MLTKFNKDSTGPCYFQERTKEELGDDCLREIKAFVKRLEVRGNSKHLVGSNVTFIDFMMLELCERIQFLSDGRLYQEHRVLENYTQNLMLDKRMSRYLMDDAQFKRRLFNASSAYINNNLSTQ